MLGTKKMDSTDSIIHLLVFVFQMTDILLQLFILIVEVERLRKAIKIAERELWSSSVESTCVKVREILKKAISNV